VIPDPYYGPAFHDQPILAIDKVRFVGEPVAVVLAADPHIAEAATHAIVADYEELPPVYDEVEAMTSKAIVHDELKPVVLAESAARVVDYLLAFGPAQVTHRTDQRMAHGPTPTLPPCLHGRVYAVARGPCRIALPVHAVGRPGEEREPFRDRPRDHGRQVTRPSPSAGRGGSYEDRRLGGPHEGLPGSERRGERGVLARQRC